MDDILFKPLNLGGNAITLKHRVVLAPLTRNRGSEPHLCPTKLHEDYYSQRASDGGLIITEAVPISPEGTGFVSVPCIWTDKQVAGWKKVVDAVHAKGGIIFLQLFHNGRVAHSSFGKHPLLKSSGRPLPTVSSSAVQATHLVTGKPLSATTYSGRADHSVPRALGTHEFPRIIDDYRKAAINCKRAGFDGVEVHAAHGYFLDQFIQNGVNKRTDKYGCETFENRCRLVFEVIEAVTKIYGVGRVGCKIGPYVKMHGSQSTDTTEIFSYLIKSLNKYNLAYLMIQEPRWSGTDGDPTKDGGFAVPVEENTRMYRKLYNNVLMGSSGFTPKTSRKAINDNLYDCICFGRFFISNPDLPLRLKTGDPLNVYDRTTFYSSTFSGGGGLGFTDYPTIDGKIGTVGKYKLIDQSDIGVSLNSVKYETLGDRSFKNAGLETKDGGKKKKTEKKLIKSRL